MPFNNRSGTVTKIRNTNEVVAVQSTGALSIVRNRTAACERSAHVPEYRCNAGEAGPRIH
jgi:hypothetical protein